MKWIGQSSDGKHGQNEETPVITIIEAILHSNRDFGKIKGPHSRLVVNHGGNNCIIMLGIQRSAMAVAQQALSGTRAFIPSQ
jgi:hypothetical protein